MQPRVGCEEFATDIVTKVSEFKATQGRSSRPDLQISIND